MAITLLLGMCLGFLAVTILVGWPMADEPAPEPIQTGDEADG